MSQPNWKALKTGLTIPARPGSGLWTIAHEYVCGPRKLKIVARGSWGLTAAHACSPDGDETSPGASGCLTDAAPRGCLIAKIGGSTADLKPAIIIAGSHTVIDLQDPAQASTASRGTLFLTMNDEPGAFQRHTGELTVDVWEAP